MGTEPELSGADTSTADEVYYPKNSGAFAVLVDSGT